MMNLEKKHGNIKWFKKNKLRIKLKEQGEKTEVWVVLEGYNICFKLMMFNFIEQLKDELMLDVSIKKVLNNQRIFIVESVNALELVNYICSFIDEWNIKITKNTVSDSDIISDRSWYEY